MSDAEENHRRFLENDDCKESCNELGVLCVVQNRVPEVKYLRGATGPFVNLSDVYEPPGLYLAGSTDDFAVLPPLPLDFGSGVDLTQKQAVTFYKTSDDSDTISRPTMEFDLCPSSAVENYLGKRVAANTIRANETACRLFTDFCSSLIDKNPQKYACFLKFVSDRKQRVSSASCTDKSFLIRLIFCNKPKSASLKSEDAGLLCHFLVDFVVHYRTKTNRKVSPSTMKSHILSIQRLFREMGVNASLFAGPVFSDPKQGLVSVLGNVFAAQQRSGTISREHNVLSLEDLRVIFTYLGSVKCTLEGYRDRLFFAVGLATGLRPMALHTLTMDQIRMETIKGEKCYVFYEKLGGNRGESKTIRGGLRNVGMQQVTIPVLNRVVLVD